MTPSITVSTDTDTLELPAAHAPELRLKVWPPEQLGAVIEAHARRHRIKLNPGEVYSWTGGLKVLRNKQRSRKGQHHKGRGRSLMKEFIRQRG